MTQLQFAPSQLNKYDIKQTKSYTDRRLGREVTTTASLGTSFTYTYENDMPRMCSTIAGTAFNPKTQECKGFSNGCQLSEFGQDGFRIASLGECGL